MFDNLTEIQRRLNFFDNEINSVCMFSHLQNICCDPSLELPHRGSSNEGSQHTFLLPPLCKKIKNSKLIIPKICLIWSSEFINNMGGVTDVCNHNRK